MIKRQTFPDHVPAVMIVRHASSARGSIRNYWPPRWPLSRKAKKHIAIYRARCQRYKLKPMV